MAPRDLILLDEAKRVIAEVTTIDEIREIRDKAEAARLYFKKAEHGLEIQNRAAEIKLRAERRGGELLTELRLGQGKRTDLVAPCDDVNSKPTLNELGINRSQSSRWKKLATLPMEKFENHIQKAKSTGRELTTAGALKLAKQHERQSIVEPPKKALESGFVTNLYQLIDDARQFETIVVDPPWQYKNQATRSATNNHCQTLSLADLQGLPIRRLAAPNSHIHLWCTTAFVEAGLHLLRHWDFDFKSILVWLKTGPYGLGNYYRGATEFLLLGVRGNCPFRDHSKPSWISAPRRSHSEKPDEVRKLIEQVSPGPYLEVFGRKPVPGWTVFGNQCTTPADDDPPNQSQ